LGDVEHPDVLARRVVAFVLIFVHLENHVVRAAIEQEVRSILETLSLVHHAVARVVLEPVGVQHVLDLVLFGQTAPIELVRVAHETKPLFVQDVQQTARSTFALDQVHVEIFLVCFTPLGFADSVNRLRFALWL
jgi:hypothetical protein